MGLNLTYKVGQTPIDEDEKEGLLIPTVTSQEELNEFEQFNIEKAIEYYLLRRKFKKDIILTQEFILKVHKQMFGDVWKWAGTLRNSNKNIGVDRFQISIRLKQLIDNCIFWIDHKTFSEEEIAIRFKHELVAIHIFPNGNGRHSRLMGDIIMKQIFKKPSFTWGSKKLASKNNNRKLYITALKKADQGDFKDLISFSMK